MMHWCSVPWILIIWISLEENKVVEEFYEAHETADKGCVGADCIQVWVRMLKHILYVCKATQALTH